MKVNRNGVRFCQRVHPLRHPVLPGRHSQPGGVFCQVFDANAPEDILRFSTIGCSAFANQMMAAGMPIEEFCTVALEAGIMQKADTLEELAGKLGFEGDAKQAFLDQARALQPAVRRPGRRRLRQGGLPPVSPAQGPRSTAAGSAGRFSTTIDGLRIRSRLPGAARTTAQAIPGLYAAGDVSGSFFSGNYPEYIVGCASGRSSTQGRHVARLLAGDL